MLRLASTAIPPPAAGTAVPLGPMKVPLNIPPPKYVEYGMLAKLDAFVFTLVTKNCGVPAVARDVLWKGKVSGKLLAGNCSLLEVSTEVVVPVTYRSPAGSIVIPLAMSVPFPERYEE